MSLEQAGADAFYRSLPRKVRELFCLNFCRNGRRFPQTSAFYWKLHQISGRGLTFRTSTPIIQQGNHSKPMTESSTQSRWPFREFRAVGSEQESAGEWTSEGGPNGKPSRGRRESHPLSIGARMMVRVSEWACKRQFGWYRRSISFCPMSGAEAVFLFPFGPGTAKTVICHSNILYFWRNPK